MNKISICIFFITSLLLVSCNSKKPDVTIVKNNAGYQLQRHGKPFYIRGAGIESHYKKFAESGGNSIRTWGVNDWPEIFAMAEKYDLTVSAGIWLEQERQGFDYSDPAAVEKQFERIKKSILKYKDHPNLLMWGIGNELDLNYTNHAVWDAIEQVAAFIKSVDKDHPTMTTTAFIEAEEVTLIKKKCPSIDILSINAYGGLPSVAAMVKEFGWTKPYLLGEWGTFGHWEVPKTSWDAPIELTSKEKATLYRDEYSHITADPNCLGGYVFFWGAKQERTPTWYSMFLENGAKTQAVDEIHYLWKENYPDNRAPVLDSLRLNQQSAHDNITLTPKTRNEATVYVEDPENDQLRISWEILHETQDIRTGGDEENKPPAADSKLIKQENHNLVFTAPTQQGAYRIFVYAYDNAGNAAHANIPFFVK